MYAILLVAANNKIEFFALPLLGGGQAVWPVSPAARAQISQLVKAASDGSAGTARGELAHLMRHHSTLDGPTADSACLHAHAHLPCQFKCLELHKVGLVMDS